MAKSSKIDMKKGSQVPTTPDKLPTNLPQVLQERPGDGNKRRK
ncbi:MAG: hypothetical protein ACD_22C00047G0013 [uncultured bacterium]|nr:MAG: hypothetical protein ACD_22C00047G0013 [uncultured bacterium]